MIPMSKKEKNLFTSVSGGREPSGGISKTWPVSEQCNSFETLLSILQRWGEEQWLRKSGLIFWSNNSCVMQTINKQSAESVTGDYMNKGVCFYIISQDLVQCVGIFSLLLIIALIS